MTQNKALTLLRLMFLISLAATMGSLFLGEVMKFPPCVLCWYQRICLYPLVLILGAALWSDDRNESRYTLPLILLGLAIASYHNLLYYGVIPESISPCTEGVSCTKKQLELFGFLTIPLMSLLTFVALSMLGFLRLKLTQAKQITIGLNQ